MHSNNKILLQNVAKKSRRIVLLSIEHFSWTPCCRNIFKFLAFSWHLALALAFGILPKQSSFCLQEFTVDQPTVKAVKYIK